MKLHVQIYLVATVGIIFSMVNGQLIEGGAHLLIGSPWDTVIKICSLFVIAGWFVEVVETYA